MDIAGDDFALFGLPRRFALDAGELDARRRALQAEAHPDRFAAASAAAERMAMQWSARINEAYGRLKDPLARARILCELAGAPVRAEDNTSMPADFLSRQMAWREALDDAASAAELRTLAADVEARRFAGYAAVGRALDETGDAAAAAREVRALMFVERFADDLAERLETAAGLGPDDRP